MKRSGRAVLRIVDDDVVNVLVSRTGAKEFGAAVFGGLLLVEVEAAGNAWIGRCRFSGHKRHGYQ